MEIGNFSQVPPIEVDNIPIHVSLQPRQMDMGKSSRLPINILGKEPQQELILDLPTDTHLTNKVLKRKNDQVLKLIKEEVVREGALKAKED